VQQAANGVKALDLLGEPPHPVMLLDLRMPVMTGWDVIDVLRSQGRADGIPIIICTSSPMDAPRGFRVIPKPPRLTELIEAIRSAARTGA
jgi:CheY-like chemotaxis protein